MAIDPKKILVVYNTSNAQSLVNANYYAVARGLGINTAGYYRLGIPFGASSQVDWPGYEAVAAGEVSGAMLLVCAESQRPGGLLNEVAYVGQRFIDAIRTMLNNNDIEAVLFESLCPKSGTVGVNSSPFEAVVTDTAAGYTLSKSGMLSPTVNGSSVAGNLYRIVPWPTKLPIADVRRITGFKYIAWGRIGYWGCTPSDIVRIVTDALWSESQDNTLKHHIIGGVSYNVGHFDADDITAHNSFNKLGYYVSHFDVSSAGYAEYNVNSLSFAAFTGGTLPVKPFGLSISSATGNVYQLFQPGGAVYNNYTPQRGSWGFWWTSSAGNFAEMAMTRVATDGSRACATFATVAEPFSNGLPRHCIISTCLLSGDSLMEALWAGRSDGNNTTILGDPLYRPYLASKLNRFNTSSLGA